ncbi:hypothetical protein MKW92_050333 [Papaver armeniacum]|nr:hypothetical protein MKW92_050333 [Papaver armeniacum]
MSNRGGSNNMRGGGRGGVGGTGGRGGGRVGETGGRGRGGGNVGSRVGETGGRGGGGIGDTGGRGGGGVWGRGRGTPTAAPISSTPPPPSVSEVGSSSGSPNVDLLALEVQKTVTVQEEPAFSFVRKEASNPARPGFGIQGVKCVVRANHFLVQLADKDLHHYDISITPEVTSRGVNRAVIGQLVDLYRKSDLGNLLPVYDGRKSLYTAGPLPFERMEFVIDLADKERAKGGSSKTDKDGKGALPRRERKFKVVIKFASRPDLHHLHQFLAGKHRDSAHEVIQALDVVMRETPSRNYVVVGRSFFSPEFGGGKRDIVDGLEVWKGYYQSIRPTQMGLSLNIDVSATSFYQSGNVIDYVMNLLNLRDTQRPLSDVDRNKIRRALTGVRVELTHRKGNRQRVSGITSQPTNQLMFPIGDGTNDSVVQYFQQKYGIRLQFPHWPCLQAGGDARPAYLPMEIVTENHYKEDAYAKEFGINVADKMTSIHGARVLIPPMLKYNDSGRDKRIRPYVGQWNMMNAVMVNGGRVAHWACLNFSRKVGEVAANRFFGQLIEMCSRKGVAFKPAPLLPMRFRQPEQIERALVDLHKEAYSKLEKEPGQGNQLQLLIIILPDQIGSYGTIKRVCETELGIVSQCCRPAHALKCNPQYLENVSMKINVKVGGRNNVLEDALMRRLPIVSESPTIIFGADVTHPQPGEDSSPSIAAVRYITFLVLSTYSISIYVGDVRHRLIIISQVVASVDWPEVSKYRCLVSAQPRRQELINDLYTAQKVGNVIELGGMIREHLRAFRRSTGQRPDRIIFYRDGVSEGQFAQVLLHEVDAIHKACQSLEEGYLPRLTFIIVQKRHHTRLFPEKHGDSNTTDKSGNILPGTVVDSMICHPTEFDFYLCSHAGIQGTSRPTHYHVLYYQNNFTADGLQTLTNNLCYTYARCTRSVSVVPPAYYAHLGAFRSRYYIEDGSDSSSSHGGGGGNTRAATASFPSLPKIKDCVREVMFYV